MQQIMEDVPGLLLIRWLVIAVDASVHPHLHLDEMFSASTSTSAHIYCGQLCHLFTVNITAHIVEARGILSPSHDLRNFMLVNID